MDIKTAQKLLGHSSPRMTLNVYTHLSREREQVSLGAIETLIDSISQGDAAKA